MENWVNSAYSLPHSCACALQTFHNTTEGVANTVKKNANSAAKRNGTCTGSDTCSSIQSTTCGSSTVSGNTTMLTRAVKQWNAMRHTDSWINFNGWIFTFSQLPPLMYKNAASSYMHHNLFIYVGSRRTSICFEFRKNAPNCLIPASFLSGSVWWMQHLSRKHLVSGRGSSCPHRKITQNTIIDATHCMSNRSVTELAAASTSPVCDTGTRNRKLPVTSRVQMVRCTNSADTTARLMLKMYARDNFLSHPGVNHVCDRKTCIHCTGRDAWKVLSSPTLFVQRPLLRKTRREDTARRNSGSNTTRCLSLSSRVS
mmetsp:Transcript_49957/g.142821  ORF Transcript_49957/g.142821 Transcript_49957/m.142821 type:complete len:313 (+) Transcript_49957:622-1560(+)